MKMLRQDRNRMEDAMRDSRVVYPKVDIIQLDRDGEYYTRHVSAMTGESLHEKWEIAAQLAWRDREIDRLKEQIRCLENDKADGPPLPE